MIHFTLYITTYRPHVVRPNLVPPERRHLVVPAYMDKSDDLAIFAFLRPLKVRPTRETAVPGSRQRPSIYGTRSARARRALSIQRRFLRRGVSIRAVCLAPAETIAKPVTVA